MEQVKTEMQQIGNIPVIGKYHVGKKEIGKMQATECKWWILIITKNVSNNIAFHTRIDNGHNTVSL